MAGVDEGMSVGRGAAEAWALLHPAIAIIAEKANKQVKKSRFMEQMLFHYEQNGLSPDRDEG